jgi:hypothetical protein
MLIRGKSPSIVAMYILGQCMRSNALRHTPESYTPGQMLLCVHTHDVIMVEFPSS